MKPKPTTDWPTLRDVASICGAVVFMAILLVAAAVLV